MTHVSLGAGASQSLSIPRGKSAIIELPVDARDVLVTNPAVADAVLRTPRRIYVLGVASGQTDAVFFDGMGRKILSLDIRVDQDVRAMSETIAPRRAHFARPRRGGEQLGAPDRPGGQRRRRRQRRAHRPAVRHQSPSR